MKKNEITNYLLTAFFKEKGYFNEIINDGEIIGLLNFFYMSVLEDLPLIERTKLMQKFVNNMVSIIVLTFFPIIEDQNIDKTFSGYRQQLFSDIVETINNSGEQILGLLNNSELRSTLH